MRAETGDRWMVLAPFITPLIASLLTDPPTHPS